MGAAIGGQRLAQGRHARADLLHARLLSLRQRLH